MRTSRADLAAGAAIVALGLAAYGGVADNGFYKDDYLWMTAARDAMNAGNLFTFTVVDFFRPLTNLVFFLSERAAPGNSAAYNAFNAAVHLVNAFLCYRLLRVLMPGIVTPLAAAAFFTVAFTHSGAILWVSARTTLIMTTFTLCSLLLIARGGRRSLAAALTVYALALATKETAVAAVGLVAVVLAYHGRLRERGKPVIGGFTLVTIVYGAARTAILGTDVETAWSPGAHVLTNVMGAVLYSYYPWDLATFFGRAAVLRGSPVAVWPELLAIPVGAVLWYVAGRSRRAMLLALAWTVVALLPSAFFSFRFLNQASHVHNRYYYLAGVGVALSVAVVVRSVRESQSSRAVGNAVAGLLFAVVVASNIHAVRDVEAYWGDSNRRFGALVGSIVDQLAMHTGEPTVVMGGLDGWQPHLTSAVQYGHTARPVMYEPQGERGLAAHAPCLYVEVERTPQGQVTFRMFAVR